MEADTAQYVPWQFQAKPILRIGLIFEIAREQRIQHQNSPLLPHFFKTMLFSGGGRPRQVEPLKSMTSTGSNITYVSVS
jgi:hypothetical protein